MQFEKAYVAATEEYSDYDRDVPAPLLRGTFLLKKLPKRAEIVITALGFYDLYINGRRITKGILAPYICNPDQVIVYDRYDLLPYLREGKNVVGLILGNGFTNNYGGMPWDIDKASFRAAPKTAFCVEADGKEVLSTKQPLKWAPSPILNDDYREGEKYDARKEIEGWNSPDFDDSAWRETIPAPTPAGRCVQADFQPIAEHKKIAAVSVIPLEEGFLYDFGVNTAGVPILKVDGKAGQKIVLVCGEWFKEGDMDTKNIQCWVRYRKMDREIQRVEYICKGEKGEGFTPCFSYYGCRYVKVTGIDASQATPDLVVFSEQGSALQKLGSFVCSDRYSNATFENTLRSDFSNFYYFPTDCPHREKSGWTGDAYLSAEQFCLLLDCEKSLEMWLSCIRDCQKESGAIPCVVPTGGWGYGWGSGPSWDAVLTAVPYYLYKYRGNRRVLEDNAGAIWKYLGFLKSIRREDGTIKYGLGDWCQIGALRDSDPWTPNEVTDTLCAMDICQKASQIFGVLAQKEREAEAKELRAQFRTAVRDHFVEWKYGADPFCRPYCLTQTAQAMMIYFGIFDEEELPHALLRMKEMLGGTENHMQVGVFGLRALLRVLSRNGMADIAYETAMSPDRPSYGNMLDHGATTLWEFIHTFAPGKEYDVLVGKIKSMNHHFWGDIAAWYLKELAGIHVNDGFTDPARVDIQPHFVRQLKYAEGRHRMPQGLVLSSWQKLSEEKVLLYVRLPEGTHGELKLQDGWKCGQSTQLQCGGNRFILERG